MRLRRRPVLVPGPSEAMLASTIVSRGCKIHDAVLSAYLWLSYPQICCMSIAVGRVLSFSSMPLSSCVRSTLADVRSVVYIGR